MPLRATSACTWPDGISRVVGDIAHVLGGIADGKTSPEKSALLRLCRLFRVSTPELARAALHHVCSMAPAMPFVGGGADGFGSPARRLPITM